MNDVRETARPGPDVLLCRDAPEARRVPVVLDSPHSGSRYPADFGHALALEHLRSAEDMFVDELFAAAPEHGAALLCAQFPRSYIDANRHPLDLDAGLLADPWPEPLRPGEKSRSGRGLIRSRTMGKALYDRKLAAAEVRTRLGGYYEPYHAALAGLIAARKARFGRVWHLNCHSWTPPLTNPATGQRINHIDICLGDRLGRTASAAFTAFVADTLRRMGYVVRVNRPFQGMELVRRHGRPADGQHSLQIEINRRLYMDHRHYTRLRDFARLQRDMTRLVEAVCAYARAQQPPHREDPAEARRRPLAAD